jgi:hypothetical protein
VKEGRKVIHLPFNVLQGHSPPNVGVVAPVTTTLKAQNQKMPMRKVTSIRYISTSFRCITDIHPLYFQHPSVILKHPSVVLSTSIRCIFNIHPLYFSTSIRCIINIHSLYFNILPLYYQHPSVILKYPSVIGERDGRILDGARHGPPHPPRHF